jgi:hypothetical protein
MTRCGTKDCPTPAVVIITGHSRDAHHAAAACPLHHTKTRAWAARAGPVHEQHLTQQQEPATLF